MIKRVFLLFEKNYLISLLITLLIAALIFYISSMPFQKGTLVDFPYKSIIYHFIIYLVFAFFLSMSLIKGKKHKNYWIFIAILIALAYATTDELHQWFVPNRYCSVSDFLIDSAGIFIGAIIYEARMRIKQHQKAF